MDPQPITLSAQITATAPRPPIVEEPLTLF
jgi:hypothetical protein